ncbi:ABC transporter substrate-binding protein [Alteribacillus sp. JSM 102045]|uniref:ABC transporter substrate-binding protein n=1 Tax=Alteribacillus sp. JSM 102045 TaxID=1562101 RepID=UPI0035C1D858
MLKKKSWVKAGFAASIVFGSLLAGCSGDDGTGNTEAGGEDGETTVTLTGWQSSPTEQRLFEEVLADFEEENPDINVEIDTIADQYMDVLRTRLVGGEAADVFFLDSFEAPGLIETGAVEPLDDYVEEDFNLDDFQEPMIQAFERDDQLWGIPKDTSNLALFYNKDLLEEAGFDGPPETWEELEDMAEELTTEDTVGFGIVTDLARLMFMPEAHGGSVVEDNRANFTDPAVIDAYEPLIEMRNEEDTAASPGDVGANNGGEMFGKEDAAMIIEGNWTIPFLEDTFPDVNYGTAEVPTINGENGTMAFTVGYAMNAASENKDAAWKLIEYLAGEEGMENWTSSGLTLPTRESVVEEMEYNEPEIYEPFLAGSEYATVWVDDTNLPIINSNFENQFNSAFIGEQSLEEAMEKAEESANNEISDE